MISITPIILCGGKGTRLWPLSRESYPKQFLSLFEENDKSLLQLTYERISEISCLNDPIIICNEQHRFLVAEQFRAIDVRPKAIILETEGKNTAPAVALGAFKAIEDDEKSILLVLSADHKIENNFEFTRVIKESLNYASKGRIITFGIIPTRPETGYGYIESEFNFGNKEIKGQKIKRFIEKPNRETAEKFIKNKNFTWNSGIFMFQTKVFLDELKKYSPNIFKYCQEAIKGSVADLDFIRINAEAFKKSPNTSIDVAVMEKTSLGTVLPLEAGWSDIGSWQSLWENEKKDEEGNVSRGNVASYNSSNCYLRSESKLLVTSGLQDLIVVETDDAIFISNKDEMDSLKSIVKDLQNKGYIEIESHLTVYRPWGKYTSIAKGKKWQVKRIEVNPGCKLSLQMHHHRSEHWVVVSGNAEVQINQKHILLSENQSTYIPVGTKHRLSNPSKIPLVIIEIQSGTYIGEDDIVRFEDLYGRN